MLKGDPNEAGVYTIMLRVPAHTQIAAHSHRDGKRKRSSRIGRANEGRNSRGVG